MLLKFAYPPGQKKTPQSIMPGAFEKKIQNQNNKSCGVMQGLDFVSGFNNSVIENLFARTCYQYLTEGGAL